MSAEPRLPAAERLASSRERMRLSMKARATATSAASDHDSPLLNALQGWWAGHPLHVAGVVAADAVKTLIRPIAQRHPIALVAGALVLGGLLVWTKPWRGILKPALLAGLLPQLLTKVMAVVPLESWLAVMASFTQRNEQPPTSPANPQPTKPTKPTESTEPTTPSAQAPLH